jgi:hypothetical protein
LEYRKLEFGLLFNLKNTSEEVFFVFAIVILISISVFAQSVSEGSVSESVSSYIGGFLEKGGINSENIKLHIYY